MNGTQLRLLPKPWEIREDHLLFPVGYVLSLSARGSGVPGIADRPWSRLSADVFFPNLPVIYSSTLRRQPPDALRGSLRVRRMLFEGFRIAMAEKTGRRSSMAEPASDSAMGAAESELSFGKPAFQIPLLAGLFVERDRFEEAEAVRRLIESQLRAHSGNQEITPNCFSRARLSSSPQYSTKRPSRTRRKNTSSTSCRRPLGATPMNSP
jgi:hypothetical protein